MSGWSSLKNCPFNKGSTLCELNSVLVSQDGGSQGAQGAEDDDRASSMVAGVLSGLPQVSVSGSGAPDLGRPAALFGGDHDLSTSSSSPFLLASSSSSDSSDFSSGTLRFLRRMLRLGSAQERLLVVEQLLLDGGGLASKVALALARFLGTGSIRTSLAKESPEELTARFTETRDYSKGRTVIKCLAWHPQVPKMAVASAADDTIHIQVGSSTTSSGPILKYKRQRGVSCMAWRPYFASELAVGCSSGLLIWNIDPCSAVARPSAGCVSSLQSPGHAPVTSISWHSNGSLLVSASPSDNRIIVWNTASETKLALWRLGPGTHLVRWCPDPAAKCVFAATTSKTFRVWRTEPWVPERWSATSGYVNCACWSPDGSALLFTTSEEELIYCLMFLPSLCPNEDGDQLLESLGSAVPIMDLTKTTAASHQCKDDSDHSAAAGGRVQSMRWNKTGDRLVVSFKDTDVLALFRTQVLPTTVDILPLGYIVGKDGEHPSCFEFLDQVPFSGALLTIAWSSGRVQHLPMFFYSLSSNSLDNAGNCSNNSFMVGFPSGVPHPNHHQNHQQNHQLLHHLSTSHLVNNTLNALGEFEPHLFSSPAYLTPTTSP